MILQRCECRDLREAVHAKMIADLLKGSDQFSRAHRVADALIAKAREVDAKLIYLANPDNPMGTWLEAGVIEQMIAQLPEGCILILDEAYIDLAPQSAVREIAIETAAVIRMRTFPKGYGLAGMRVGYAMGAAELIRSFEKIRNHFGMNRLAQIA